MTVDCSKRLRSVMTFKKRFISIAIVVVVVLVAGLGFVYYSFHPEIMIHRTIQSSSVRFSEEYYCERIMIVTTNIFGIPTAKSVTDRLNELFIWCDEINTDLVTNYVAPLHIAVSGEVENGKTTFWYEGYVTTKEGKTIDYKEEKTFDYVFVSGDKLLQ